MKFTALSAPYNNNKILSYCCVDHIENVINELVYASAGAYGKAGIRNPDTETEPEPDPELKLRKLGSTETSSRYPYWNRIQDGVLCYHCFEKFSAQ